MVTKYESQTNKVTSVFLSNKQFTKSWMHSFPTLNPLPFGPTQPPPAPREPPPPQSRIRTVISDYCSWYHFSNIVTCRALLPQVLLIVPHWPARTTRWIIHPSIRIVWDQCTTSPSAHQPFFERHVIGRHPLFTSSPEDRGLHLSFLKLQSPYLILPVSTNGRC